MPAIVGKPAPAWKGMAVVDGEIKEVSLEDYKGESTACVQLAAQLLHKWLPHHRVNSALIRLLVRAHPHVVAAVLIAAGKYCVFFFYPLDFTFVW